uniref:Uncharacterized protein n=1 Tax=Myotis myotis TaxID=51298 RepID=A0A7J8AN55_MYOMY|nr:hypothetical protein mMyoMyo1_008132 [Myotis myotis]
MQMLTGTQLKICMDLCRSLELFPSSAFSKTLLRISVALASLDSQLYRLNALRLPGPMSPGRMLEHSWGSCFIFPFSQEGSLCLAAWLSNVPKNFVLYILSVSLIASCGRINLVPDSPSNWNLKSLAFLIFLKIIYFVNSHWRIFFPLLFRKNGREGRRGGDREREREKEREREREREKERER